MYLVFFCRGSVHQLQPGQQYLTTIHHTKSILFIDPSSTHSTRLKRAHTTPVTGHRPARQSQKPGAKVTADFVQHFQSGVAGHHGYMCNLMLRYLRVSAVFSCFHIAVSDSIHALSLPAAIRSALRNLQLKIRWLELEKRQAELDRRITRRDVTHTRLRSDKVTQTLENEPTEVEQGPSGRSSCNQGGCRRKYVLAR